MAWTLQAVLFLLIVLGAVVFAAESIPSDDQRDRYTDLQRQQLASDLLDITAATGALNNATLYWNASTQRFINATGPNGTYTTLQTGGDHPLWPAVNTGLRSQELAYNIEIGYQTDVDGDGDLETVFQTLVSQGPPGRDATAATGTVYLQDSDVPAASSPSNDGDPCTLEEMGGSTSTGSNGCRSDAYFAPDFSPSSTQYNILQIRVTVWST